MPIKLDIKKKMTQPSDRVKSVDMHPTEPWVLCALYSGKVVIYNYNTGQTFKTFEVSDQPVRCAKFIVRKQWIVTGADDYTIRVFNYNTMERVSQFEGHQDYIRYLEVHPSQPYVLTSSDDMTVKLWDWEKGWSCVQTYEGHAHYVMMVRINPKDTNTFATASLDRSIKVWSFSSPTPNFSLEGHERGVNCIDYYPGGDKPYIVSGADDQLLKIWDYQTRSCVATLEGHTNNVCAVAFHSKLPVIISGSEDSTVRVWHNTTYRLENTLNYGLERAWAVSASANSTKVALGYDEGTIVIKLGKESPIASMDKNGKIVIARNNVIHAAAIRSSAMTGFDEVDAPPAPAGPAPVDGETLPISEKEVSSVELFPVSIQHNANGRFVAIVGDNEYVIYTAQALRNKSFGNALDFVWSAFGTGDYAVRESTTKIKVFKNFKESHSFRPAVAAEAIYGGALLAVRSHDTIIFYDWDSERIVTRIEVAAKGVHWNESGELVAITTDDSFFVLRFDRDAFNAAVATAHGTAAAATLAEEGVEAAFSVEHEIDEKVRNGTWVGDCFLYTNSSNRLNYYVGGKVMTLAHLDRHMYMLGYLQKEGRVYLMDKSGAIVSYGLLLALLEYQTAVVRKDFAAANGILPEIPREQYNAIAKFLDSQGFKEQALAVAEDADLKFDLAVQLNKLDVAYRMLTSATDTDSADAQSKWKTLMDLALARSNLTLAEECALAARDVGGLLLLYSSTGNAQGMKKLASMAMEEGRTNIAFLALHSLGLVDECAQLLADSGRIAEAVFFARTYCPSMVASLMPMWRADASKHSRRAADALGDPVTTPEKFADFEVALKAEEIFKRRRDSTPVTANVYLAAKGDLDVDVISTVKERLSNPTPSQTVAPQVSAASQPSAQSPPVATPAAVQNARAEASNAVVEPLTHVESAKSTPSVSPQLKNSIPKPSEESFHDAAGEDDLSEVFARHAHVSSREAGDASLRQVGNAPATSAPSPERMAPATARVPASSPASAPLPAPSSPAPAPASPAPAPVHSPVPSPASSPAPAQKAPAKQDPIDEFDIDDTEWQ